MRGGRLRHYVTVQQAVEANDTFGEAIQTWSEYLQGWASIEPLHGTEYMDGKQLEGAVDHRVRMRYRSGIVPKMRIYWHTRIFEIVSVMNRDERDAELELMCFEVI